MRYDGSTTAGANEDRLQTFVSGGCGICIAWSNVRYFCKLVSETLVGGAF